MRFSLGFAKKNEVFITVFGLSWNLWWAAIVTLPRENTERKGVGWHYFKCWSVFVTATEKKIIMQQEVFVHENELYSKIVHKLLATNFTIWPNSNSQKNYQANSKTINRINENCLSVQVLPSSKLFSLIFLTLEFLISVHTNFHHTSSNQGSNESLNVRMSLGVLN